MALESDMGREEEGPFEQFEKCDKNTCIYYNEEGRCCYETCRRVVENPMEAPLVIKICKICGLQFATNMNDMPVQFCPECLDGLLKAEGHPHNCIFCGEEIDSNPSILWPVCSDCFKNLTIVATGSPECLDKAANMAHCDSCG